MTSESCCLAGTRSLVFISVAIATAPSINQSIGNANIFFMELTISKIKIDSTMVKYNKMHTYFKDCARIGF